MSLTLADAYDKLFISFMGTSLKSKEITVPSEVISNILFHPEFIALVEEDREYTKIADEIIQKMDEAGSDSINLDFGDGRVEKWSRKPK